MLWPTLCHQQQAPPHTCSSCTAVIYLEIRIRNFECQLIESGSQLICGLLVLTVNLFNMELVNLRVTHRSQKVSKIKIRFTNQGHIFDFSKINHNVSNRGTT